ncbi:MAG: hypothetical protein QOC95_1109 [Thermoleophilaceae bacterium]|nr:hypothetical protein [Thermoleophilaceae bacterium]
MDGSLTLDTFAHRVDAAYRARTEEELAVLLADLPGRRGRLRAVVDACRRVVSGVGKRPVAGPPALEIEVRLPRDIDALTVGRSSDCDVVVGERSVSRHHAELRHDDHDDWTVRDLDSTNGTWVNGARVREARIAGGDVLSLGGLRMELRL